MLDLTAGIFPPFRLRGRPRGRLGAVELAGRALWLRRKRPFPRQLFCRLPLLLLPIELLFLVDGVGLRIAAHTKVPKLQAPAAHVAGLARLFARLPGLLVRRLPECLHLGTLHGALGGRVACLNTRRGHLDPRFSGGGRGLGGDLGGLGGLRRERRRRLGGLDRVCGL